MDNQNRETQGPLHSPFTNNISSPDQPEFVSQSTSPINKNRKWFNWALILIFTFAVIFSGGVYVLKLKTRNQTAIQKSTSTTPNTLTDKSQPTANSPITDMMGKKVAFDEIELNYYRFYPVVTVGDKIAFLGDKDEKGTQQAIVYDGKEIWQGKTQSVPTIIDVGGKLAFTLEANGERYTYYNGEELAKGYRYIYIKNVGGKLAFTAVNGHGKTVVFHDGKEIETTFTGASGAPIDIGGKVAVNVGNYGALSVLYDGALVGNVYDYIHEIIGVGGKPAFLALKEKKYLVVYSGQEFGKDYDKIEKITDIDGRLSFIATKGNKTFIVYDGKEIGKDYDDVSNPTDIGGKLAFIAKKDNKKFIYYDGQELGKDYDDVLNLTNVDNRLTFNAKKMGKTFIIHDGQEIGKDYDSAYNLTKIGSKLAFIAQRGDKYFAVYDGKQLGKDYDGISNFIVKGDKFVFTVANKYVKGIKRFVIYNGIEIGEKYDTIDEKLMFAGDKLVFLAAKNGKKYIVIEK